MYSISSIEKFMGFFSILFANNLLYERQESNANGMDFFILQIIRIYYVLCFVHVMSNASEIISNIFMFLMYSPLLLLFLLCNYLHNFRNLKIENEHVHIFWYLMFVCVISISMHVYIYLHVI